MLSFEPALLSNWDVVRQVSAQEVIWDICVRPLLFGPVGILDNMVIDNRHLVEVLALPGVEEILSLYAEAGIVKLCHRPEVHRGTGQYVECADHIPLIWLKRPASERYTVRFVCLDKDHSRKKRDRNIELHDLISSNDGSDDAILDSFWRLMDDEMSGQYRAAFHCIDRVFFRRPARKQIEKFPRLHLQHRILGALGIGDPEAMIASAAGGSLTEVLHSSPYMKAGSDDETVLDFREVIRRASEGYKPEQDFIETLNQTIDPSRPVLLNAANRVMLDRPEVAAALADLVNREYILGLPRANEWPQLWDWPVRRWPDGSIPDDSRDSLAQRLVPEEIYKIVKCEPELVEKAREMPNHIRGNERALLRQRIEQVHTVLFGKDLRKRGIGARLLPKVTGVLAGGVSTFCLTTYLPPHPCAWASQLNAVLWAIGTALLDIVHGRYYPFLYPLDERFSSQEATTSAKMSEKLLDALLDEPPDRQKNG